jgi:hypothetical protein
MIRTMPLLRKGKCRGAVYGAVDKSVDNRWKSGLTFDGAGFAILGGLWKRSPGRATGIQSVSFGRAFRSAKMTLTRQTVSR